MDRKSITLCATTWAQAELLIKGPLVIGHTDWGYMPYNLVVLVAGIVIPVETSGRIQEVYEGDKHFIPYRKAYQFLQDCVGRIEAEKLIEDRRNSGHPRTA